MTDWLGSSAALVRKAVALTPPLTAALCRGSVGGRLLANRPPAQGLRPSSSGKPTLETEKRFLCAAGFMLGSVAEVCRLCASDYVILSSATTPHNFISRLPKKNSGLFGTIQLENLCSFVVYPDSGCQDKYSLYVSPAAA